MNRQVMGMATRLAVAVPALLCGAVAGFVAWDRGWPGWGAGLVGILVAGLAALMVMAVIPD
jgi:fructose-specific phosphotransferase system IIC component